ncbi:MAG TPA: tRNA guanosine(15) transglycosylase TgtA [Candidatus Acidoferrales bacterium]|nr:tRNA guanosine(15) transglycosylase TgtA [Candidatus Acidoferrales bacterium]
MTDVFEITHKDVLGRIGKLTTAHGVVETPALMPVINPNMMILNSQEIQLLGAQILITNSYIIYKHPNLKEFALTEGVHKLLSFDGPIMTDSGSYQLSVYGDIEFTSKEMVIFQKDIGSDIGTPIDIPTPPGVSYNRALKEMELTLERIKEAKDYIGGKMLLTGPLQGSTHLDLREKFARMISELDVDICPIGAVVPLMESYRFKTLAEVVLASKKGFRLDAPVHLFGAGHPMMFALAVALGCDLFDSAAYARYARDRRYLTSNGTYALSDLKYLPCSCPICSNGQSDLSERELAEHNLRVSFAEIQTIKQAIRDGTLWELVEKRCRHPALLSALRAIFSHSEYIEEYEPQKWTFLYTSEESAKRPAILRHLKKLKNLHLKGRILITTNRKKTKHLEDEFDGILLMKAPFGPYSPELGETYPIGQSEVSSLDNASKKSALYNLIELIKSKNFEATFAYDDDWEHEFLYQLYEYSNLLPL